MRPAPEPPYTWSGHATGGPLGEPYIVGVAAPSLRWPKRVKATGQEVTKCPSRRGHRQLERVRIPRILPTTLGMRILLKLEPFIP
jgi:hypothetical protein